MSLITLTPQQLRQAADLQERILDLQAELSEILVGEMPIPSATEAPRSLNTGRRKISAAGRARIAAAQKARWAAKRREAAAKTAPAKVTQVKPKRYISPALRKARSEAMKARWAKAKRAGKSRP